MEAGAGLNDHVTFGFAFLDAAAGHFYLGSLSDGAGRANLTTLLTQAGPSSNLFCRQASMQGCCVRVCAVRIPATSAGKVQDQDAGPLDAALEHPLVLRVQALQYSYFPGCDMMPRRNSETH